MTAIAHLDQLTKLLGGLPPRPTAVASQVHTTTQTEHYTRHNLTFDNAHDSHIPAVLLAPRHAKPPYPAVLYLHAHGHRYDLGKNEVFAPRAGDIVPADALTAQGYAVLCHDAYAFGGRQHPDELTLFKQFLWEGKTLWGMMLRDDQIALDLLDQHPLIDSNRIAAVGMSLGSTRAWWLAALEERIRATVAVACLTRYQDLIAADGLPHHSIYFYVPGILQHFDTEAILARITPRPLLCLTGDQDPTSPASGIHKIEAYLRNQYTDIPQNFRNVIYPGLGHTFTSEMWHELTSWLTQHL
jgi:dienelactone hydrolase